MAAGTEEIAAIEGANANLTTTTTKTESILWRLAMLTPLIATGAAAAQAVRTIAVEAARRIAMTSDSAEKDIANRSGASAVMTHPKVRVTKIWRRSADSTCLKAKTVNSTLATSSKTAENSQG